MSAAKYELIDVELRLAARRTRDTGAFRAAINS